MATVPLSGTNIRLLTGVPFSSDYKNTRWFDDKQSQTNYFLNKPTTYDAKEHAFQRIEGRSFIAVKKSIDSLWGTNYLMFQNAEYNSKWFYAFVTKLEYVNLTTTYVHFVIDVLQTWKFDVNFKPSYIVREHCKLWNEDGTPVVNTIDEGLNYGTEYETVSVENYRPTGDIYFLVIVSKETLHTATKQITPTYNGMPQPLSYYVHPFRLVGGEPVIMYNGQPLDVYTDIVTTLKSLMKGEMTVNEIISLYVTEFPGRYITYEGGVVDMDSDAFEKVTISNDGVQGVENVTTFYVKNIKQYDSITNDFGNKYNGFKPVTESKLMMYPYCVTTIDDFKGNRMEIKNEYIKSNNLTLRVKGSLGTSNKVAYSVDNYLTKDGLSFDEMFTQSLERALISNNPNDISIISDYLSAYLQANRNSIDQQKQSAMFNMGLSALSGGMVGMAQSSWIGKQGTKGTRMNSYSNISVNPFGMGAAGLSAVTGVADSVEQILALNAKQRDADNVPPQMVKMGGNSAFDYGNGYSGVYIVKKQVTEEYRKKLTDFFNMFGYKVNELKTPNFHTRQNWNYVHTNNCNVIGNLNNDDLQEFKNVFDNGITLWHTDDVGNYALENGVI